MKPKTLFGVFFCAALFLYATGVASAAEYGPWRPKSCVNLEPFFATHFVDHSDVNNYLDDANIDHFGYSGFNGYASRATPVYGLRLGMVFNRFIADLQTQYYKEIRKGRFPYHYDDNSDKKDIETGAMLSGISFMFHFGFDLVQSRFQLYPYFGLGWSYTNFTLNGGNHDRDKFSPGKSKFPDYAGAKEGVPGDVGLGFELQNPIWSSKDESYRQATNVPIFVHVGYQGELITYYWQVKQGSLNRAVSDRFMGPYVRMGVGIGKGKYTR